MANASETSDDVLLNDPKLLARIDAARGEMSRQEWARVVLEMELESIEAARARA